MFQKKQYQFVQESRKILFDYCKSISKEDFINQKPSFGRGGSIRNLLVHIANTYEFWVAKQVLQKEVAFSEFEMNNNIEDVIKLFSHVDDYMSEFIELMKHFRNKIEYEINGKANAVEPIKIFTHVITHEYHHKGQILSLSRQLGYVPVDTDIMR